MMFDLVEEIMWKGEKARLVRGYKGRTGIYGIYVSMYRRYEWENEFVFTAVAPALLKDVSIAINLDYTVPSYHLIVESLQKQAVGKLEKEIEEIPYA